MTPSLAQTLLPESCHFHVANASPEFKNTVARIVYPEGTTDRGHWHIFEHHPDCDHWFLVEEWYGNRTCCICGDKTAQSYRHFYPFSGERYEISSTQADKVYHLCFAVDELASACQRVFQTAALGTYLLDDIYRSLQEVTDGIKVVEQDPIADMAVQHVEVVDLGPLKVLCGLLYYALENPKDIRNHTEVRSHLELPLAYIGIVADMLAGNITLDTYGSYFPHFTKRWEIYRNHLMFESIATTVTDFHNE